MSAPESVNVILLIMKMLLIILVLVFTLWSNAWARSPKTYTYTEFSTSVGYDSFLSSQLSNDQIEAIAFYQSSGFEKINQYLRSSKKPWWRWKIKKLISKIDISIAEMTRLPDVFLYRGIKLNLEMKKSYRKGSIIHEHAFTSTSLNPSVTKRFSRARDGNSESAIFIIYNNNEKKGIFIGGGEEEVLLPRDNYYKVMLKKKTGAPVVFLLYRCDEPDCSNATLPDILPEPLSHSNL